MESQPTSELPFTDDFSDCENWLEDETDTFSLSCEDGQYHFVATAAERADSAVTGLSETTDGISVAVDARPADIDRLSAIGLGCWHGREEGSPGYRIVVGPSGWNILKERGDGTAADLPSSESGLSLGSVGDVLHVRADCLAGPSETTVTIFVDGTLLGTGHDVQGVDQFDTVGIIVSAATAPLAVDFDNFHVEAAQVVDKPASAGTQTSLESEDVLLAETRDAQKVPDRAAFFDSLSPKEQRALEELQTLLNTDSGITPDEVAKVRHLLRVLGSG